jgi:hypothetical protein
VAAGRSSLKGPMPISTHSVFAAETRNRKSLALRRRRHSSSASPFATELWGEVCSSKPSPSASWIGSSPPSSLESASPS